MQKSEILQTLILQFANGNKAKFSRMLGIKPATVNSWFKRNSFDLELVYKNCEDLSGDWLLSGGDGPMLRSDRTEFNSTTAKLNSGVVELNSVATAAELDDLRAQLRSSREAVGELYEENRRLRAQLAVLQASSTTA